MTKPFNNDWEALWPGGYRENFAVYEPKVGVSEKRVLDSGLDPFTDFKGTALEIGCGGCYWVQWHLLPRFAKVIGVDVIPEEWVAEHVKDPRFTYHMVPDGDCSLAPVADESVDFVWSFGCLCHLQFDTIAGYLRSIFRVLKPGRFATLEGYDRVRRPEAYAPPSPGGPVRRWSTTSCDEIRQAAEAAGFASFKDLFPETKSLLVTVRKPQRI